MKTYYYFILIPLSMLVNFSASCIESMYITWLLLEMNTAIYLTMLSTYNFHNNKPVAINYFLIQTFTSALILAGSTNMMYMNSYSFMNKSFLTQLSMYVKLSGYPFHIWYLYLIMFISWPNLFWLTTFQKFIPMLMCYHMDLFSINQIMIIACFNSLMSGFHVMKSSNFKKIITFSSMNHTSWMLILIQINISTWTLYFYIYTTTTLLICIIMHKMKIHLVFNISTNKLPMPMKFYLIILFLTYSSIPPMTGFMTKWISLQSYMISGINFMCLLLLILVSLIFTYTFLRTIQETYFINNNLMLLNYLKTSHKINLFNSMLFMIISFTPIIYFSWFD